MLLSELAEAMKAMISIHGDHEIYHSEGRRELMPVGEESIYFSEDEKAYYI